MNRALFGSPGPNRAYFFPVLSNSPRPRSHASQSLGQPETACSDGRSPKPWPPVAKTCSSTGTLHCRRARAYCTLFSGLTRSSPACTRKAGGVSASTRISGAKPAHRGSSLAATPNSGASSSRFSGSADDGHEPMARCSRSGPGSNTMV